MNPSAPQGVPLAQFKRKILLVSANGIPGEPLLHYAMHLSGRTGCEILALTEAAMAQNNGAPDSVEFIVQKGDLTDAVDMVCRDTRRIEFILTDTPQIRQLLAGVVMIPVFGVAVDTLNQPGGTNMSTTTFAARRRPVGKTIFCGCLSAVLYAAYFGNSGFLTPLFSRGGAYAALPIATVFLFSFVHAAFASNFWSLIGIEARTRIEAHKSVSAGDRPTQTKPKQPRVYAHVNPFHNLQIKK
jgi:hypothetical protein